MAVRAPLFAELRMTLSIILQPRSGGPPIEPLQHAAGPLSCTMASCSRVSIRGPVAVPAVYQAMHGWLGLPQSLSSENVWLDSRRYASSRLYRTPSGTTDLFCRPTYSPAMATHSLTDKQQRRCLWKLDILLMPILTVSYGLQFYDKAVLGGASVLGIIEDLGLSTTTPTGAVSTIRYSTATAAFYWGYIISVLPIALLLQSLPLGKASAGCVFIWGAIVFLTCACTSYEGLTAQRFFLGFVEAAVSPAFVAISTMFYTKREYSARIGFWYSATGIFSMFSGVLNYALGTVNSSIATWKILYLFAGSWTIAWSFVMLFCIPDSIDKATRFFSAQERQFLKQRVEKEVQGADDKKFRKDLVLDALKDPLVYVYMVIGALIYICNGGVTAFGARIIRTFGYTSLQAILLQIPGGASTVLAIAICVWIDGRFKNMTCYLMALSCVPVIIGSIIIWKGSWRERGLPLFGYTLIPVFGAPYIMLLSLAARNTAGGTKKAIVNGAIFIGYCIGNIIGPYTVLTPEAPVHYRTTWITLICSMSIVVVMSFGLRAYFIWENKRRDRLYGPAFGTPASEQGKSTEGEKTLDSDTTGVPVTLERRFDSDRQNKSFRYSY